jgi:hypothetical protein
VTRQVRTWGRCRVIFTGSTVPASVLAARGFEVPVRLRDRALACTDLASWEAWAGKTATAASI